MKIFTLYRSVPTLTGEAGLTVQILAWGWTSPPPIGGGPKGGDKGPMGGDWRVICAKILGTKKMSVYL